MLRWLVLDLNSFFASCEQQEDPELRGKPVIVVPTMAETTCAIAASYPAKAFGIRTGTLVHEARRLCPEVRLVQAHHKLYVEYHHWILSAIDKHIPVEDVMSIDEVACRLDKVQQAPAVAERLAHTIKREIQTQVGECLTSSIGISANRLLAGFYCRRLQVEVKWLGRDRGSWADKHSFSETQDTGMLLHVLQDLWSHVPAGKPLRVGIALTGLVVREEHQPDLFDNPKNAKLVLAIDAVNEKFGKGALIYGDSAPAQTSKIAFQRVPKVKEF